MSKAAFRPRYSQAQQQRYKRQRYIAQIGKITKNLYKMFKEPSIEHESFVLRFEKLITKLEELEEVRVDSRYVNASKEYIYTLLDKVKNAEFDEQSFSRYAHEQLSYLNRLQKIKNRSSYQKSKHKLKRLDDQWQ